VHFNPDNPIVVETDTSEYVIAAIISQISPNDGDIHPIMFYLCSMQLAEINYKIYDKELLAIFEAFRQWHNYLEGSAHIVLVLSDHENLEYFATTKQLTHHQVCWSEYLSGFNYLICYHAGWLGTKPDALTCWVYPHGENVYTLANLHNFHSMFKAGQLLQVIILNSAFLLISIQHGLQAYPIAQSHLTCLRVCPDLTTTTPVAASPSDPWSLSQDGDFLLYRGCPISLTIRTSNGISFTPTMTITWLDTWASPR